MNQDGVSSSSSSLITGGFTLLEAIQQQHQEQQQNSSMQEMPQVAVDRSISTGSTSLDRLLSSATSCNRYKKRKRDLELDLRSTTNNIKEEETMLGTGMSWKKITQVSGPPSSGKTQLGLTLSVNCVLSSLFLLDKFKANVSGFTNENETIFQKEYIVYYITSSGSGDVVEIEDGGGGPGFVTLARRLRHMVDVMEKEGKITAASRQQVLDGIVLDGARDGYELLARLHDFEQELHARADRYDATGSDEQQQQGMLLVIDSISGCLVSLLYAEGDGGVGAALLNEIHLILRRISRFSEGCFAKYGVAVFVINGMVSDFIQGGRKPALGHSWRAADVHIVLEPGREVSVVSQKICTANDLQRVVIKSISGRLYDGDCQFGNSGGVGGAIEFGIGPAGIVDL